MNVLVICVDTLRWDHCGYNRRLPVRTPNIDRLAARSTIFDRAVIGSFPTVPMRTDCFTGNVNFPRYDWQPLAENEVPLSAVMSAAGWRTALVYDRTPLNGMARGFDEVLHSFHPPADRPKPEDVPFPCPKENLREEGRERQMLMAEMNHVRHERDHWVATSMTRAAEWLEDNARRERWMLWVDTWEPHEVWHTPPYYVESYDPGYQGIDYDAPNYGAASIYSKRELKHLWAHYAAEVTMTDRWIGHLLAQLDVMALWDSTLVICISDHGTYIGEHGRTGKHTVNGYADIWPLYEEVSHIPLLVWLPGRRRPRKRVKALAQPADLPATILDVCGVRGPAMHGRSWLPLMTGRRRRNWDVVFSSKHDGPREKHSRYPTRLTATTGRWAYIAAEAGMPPELYDLRSDPRQTRNVARGNPAVVRRLQAQVVAFMREQRAADAYVARFEQ